MFIKDFIKKVFRDFILKSSIKKRLIIYFILSVVIPTSIISVTIYYRSADIITRKMDSSIEKNLNTAEAIILQEFQHINDIANLIAFNPKLMEILAGEKPDKATAVVGEINTLNDVLESYYLSNLSNFTKTNLFPSIYMLDRPEYNNFGISDKVFDISLVEKEKWYTDFNDGYYAIVGPSKLKTLINTMDCIRVARKLYAIRPGETTYAALLTMDMETAYFNNILNDFKSSPNSIIIITDDSYSVMMSNIPEMVGQNIQNEKYTDDNYETSYSSKIQKVNGVQMLVSVKKIPELKWSIISLSPLDELNGELVSFNKVMYAVLFICLGIAFLTALLLAGDISKPINKLVKSMSTVQNGNFEIDLVYKRKDEFSFLISRYKKMLSEIKELIDELYVSELNKKKAELKAKDAELKALQAQINPHFLYNTLDSINWLAMKLNANDISIMVKSLSNFFRYSLSQGKNIITLEDETRQIESYLRIQEVRFKNKLSYVIDFQPDILKYYTVKLILQPLVENAIIHGIEKRKGEGFIEISGIQKDDTVEIRITDDGVGADADKLNGILDGRVKESASFGIKNVHGRIKHFFGEAYGLSYVNNEDSGITAIITIPAVKNLEDIYVEDDYC